MKVQANPCSPTRTSCSSKHMCVMRDPGKKVRNSVGRFKLALPDERLSPFNSVTNARGAHPQSLRPKILVIFRVQKYLAAFYPPDHDVVQNTRRVEAGYFRPALPYCARRRLRQLTLLPASPPHVSSISSAFPQHAVSVDTSIFHRRRQSQKDEPLTAPSNHLREGCYNYAVAPPSYSECSWHR
jgi:hypothetical protein